jgi:hypothetical protein
MKHLVSVVWPLLTRQTRPPDKVVVNVPRKYHDAALGNVATLPMNVRRMAARDARVVFNRECDDLGPGTKITGLSNVAELDIRPDDLIIYIDDDVGHDPKMIARHVLAHAVHARHVFCGRGSTLDLETYDRAAVRGPPMLPVDVPEGCGSVSVRAGDANLDALATAIDNFRDSPSLFYSDDVVIGNHFWGTCGLTVRLLPCPFPVSATMAHAHDAMALMNGRKGTLSDTRTRMLDAARILKRRDLCSMPGFGLRHRKYETIADFRRVTLGMVPLAMPDRPPDDGRAVAVVVFAFDRPEYLERVLRSLRQSPTHYAPEHTHVFVDGALNAHSGELRGRPSNVAKSAALVHEILGPKAHLWCGACNYGVGLMQFYGLWRVFAELRYDAAIMLEDDLVLGRNYLSSTMAMLPTLRACPQLSAVQAGYRRQSAEPNDVSLLDARAAHVHYWGWLSTRDRFNRIFRRYSAATSELFFGVDYMWRNVQSADKIGAWFRKGGMSPKHRSQDWVRDACFRLEGMTHKLVCPCRRAAPIGVHGLHSSPTVFKDLGLDASTRDIDAPGTFDPEAYRLVMAVTVRPGVPQAIASRFASDGAAPCMVVATETGAPVPAHRPALLVCTNGAPADARAAMLGSRDPDNTRLVAQTDDPDRPPAQFGRATTFSYALTLADAVNIAALATMPSTARMATQRLPSITTIAAVAATPAQHQTAPRAVARPTVRVGGRRGVRRRDQR